MDGLIKRIPQRILSIIVFSLLFSWLLAFPFEGQILYALADEYGLSTGNFVSGIIAVHFTGLILCGFYIKDILAAKKLILFSILFCIATSAVFFFEPSILWNISLMTASFLSGCSVAAWGYFLKRCTLKNERIKTVADGLILSNILMILLNMSAIHISPKIALVLSILLLSFAFIFALRLPGTGEQDCYFEKDQKEGISSSISKPLIFLCIFVIVITINSGLMYRVQGPAFDHLGWLTSWYWAVPYIFALFIMRNLPRSTNRTYILYAAIAMIGFSFIFFTVFDRSAFSYLVVNTLMLGACGVFDLFWWSILGEMLDYDRNPARVLGTGLAANVLGVLLGGLVGYAIGDGLYSSLLALSVVCITLVLLPPLHRHLNLVLKDHIYLTALSEIPNEERGQAMECILEGKLLSARESEIAQLLTKGKTYKAIAEELHVSKNTVKTHIKNIYYKYNVQSRGELVSLLFEPKNRE